eukprot:2446121-Prymnesium_polylepis.1
MASHCRHISPCTRRPPASRPARSLPPPPHFTAARPHRRSLSTVATWPRGASSSTTWTPSARRAASTFSPACCGCPPTLRCEHQKGGR